MKKILLAVLTAFFVINSAYSAKRIVSLCPSGTEIICALGAKECLAARTDFCNYPEDVKSIPSIGGFDGRQVSVEAILYYKPDFVYASKGMHDFLVKQLNAFGVEVYLSDCNSFEAIYKEIKYIGEVTDRKSEAESVIKGMKEKIKKVQEKISSDSLYGKKSEKIKVYYEVWNVPYMSAGKKSFINEIITLSGGENIFCGVSDSYPVVSDEEILMAKPEVILIPDMNGVKADTVGSRKGWSRLPAVRNKRIYVLPGDIFSRPGPRAADAVVQLYGILSGK